VPSLNWNRGEYRHAQGEEVEGEEGVGGGVDVGLGGGLCEGCSEAPV